VDARCDVYALGVILYEMLTGKVPFDRPNSVNILMAHVHEAVPSVSTMNPHVHVSPQLEAVVMKAMAKKPDERYASMEELLNALKEVQDAGFVHSRSTEISSESSLTGLDSHSGGYHHGPGLTSTGATPSASWNGPIKPVNTVANAPTGRWKIFTGVIALAIVFGIGLAFFGRREPPPAPIVVGGQPRETTPTPVETGTVVVPGETIAPSEAAQAPAPGTVRIALRSEPAGALVIVGNRSYRTPADVEWAGEDATPGREVTFQFELDGYRDMSVSRVMQAGTMTVSATLEEGGTGRVRRPVRRPTMTGSGGTGPIVTPHGYREQPY
jgi:serine/threonine-protein kinase